MKRQKKKTRKKKQQINQTIQLEDINQKILSKEGRIKRYLDWFKAIQSKQDFPK